MVKPIYIDTPIQGKDIKLTVSGSRGAEIQRALETRSKMLGKVKGYEYSGPNNFRTNSTRFTPPVYDLA
ncbi:MAG: hypothetical protein KDH96_12555, partial [Candidatus Riesia sp.]|nr:hypothetical protein [Candidatus Riesia sp.]